MRVTAQNLVDRDLSRTNKNLLNALELIDRATGPKTIVINSSTLGSKVMPQNFKGNIDHVKIACLDANMAGPHPPQPFAKCGLVRYERIVGT